MTSDELFALKPQLEAEAKRQKALRRIDRMHLLYGRRDDQVCGDCAHFVERRYANPYYKCELYGVSHGAATDWRVRYVACGKFEAQTND